MTQCRSSALLGLAYVSLDVAVRRLLRLGQGEDQIRRTVEKAIAAALPGTEPSS